MICSQSLALKSWPHNLPAVWHGDVAGLRWASASSSMKFTWQCLFSTHSVPLWAILGAGDTAGPSRTIPSWSQILAGTFPWRIVARIWAHGGRFWNTGRGLTRHQLFYYEKLIHSWRPFLDFTQWSMSEQTPEQTICTQNWSSHVSHFSLITTSYETSVLWSWRSLAFSWNIANSSSLRQATHRSSLDPEDQVQSPVSPGAQVQITTSPKVPLSICCWKLRADS